jgi:hypothetical protein
VRRGEVADAGAGDGGGLVRRHHVVPFPRHRPSPASEAAAADAPRGRAGEERGARRARERCGEVVEQEEEECGERGRLSCGGRIGP